MLTNLGSDKEVTVSHFAVEVLKFTGFKHLTVFACISLVAKKLCLKCEV